MQGCRLPSGGGTSDAGAMPFLHRWVGNPMLFLADGADHVRAPIHDVYCGMRGFTQGVLRPTGAALHRDGVRHGDDHQGEPLQATDRRNADHAAPRRPKAHAAAPADVPRRLADAALLPDVQPQVAVHGPRHCADRAGRAGVDPGPAWVHRVCAPRWMPTRSCAPASRCCWDRSLSRLRRSRRHSASARGFCRPTISIAAGRAG